MKIALNGHRRDEAQSGPAAKIKAIEKDLLAAKRGDWESKHRVERAMMPLLTNLAKKRSTENADINRLIERGKEGIAIAIRKFKTGTHGDRFEMFALPFVEARMDKPAHSGFFSRLFHRD